MEIARAKEIVQALADGVDPYTGDPFPADGPYQRADTVRALYKLLESADSGTQQPSPAPPTAGTPRRSGPEKAGGKWTPEEEEKLRTAYAADKSIHEIAADHDRTPGAISSRLVKLGLIEDSPQNRPGQGRTPPPSKPAPPPPPGSAAPFDPDDCPF